MICQSPHKLLSGQKEKLLAPRALVVLACLFYVCGQAGTLTRAWRRRLFARALLEESFSSQVTHLYN